MTQEGNVCSVCWDTFKLPKMLPCKHSFCISCLLEYLGGFEDKSNLVCPLCREPCFVPDKGFSDFPTNYFVPIEKIPETCPECKILSVCTACQNCNAYMCKKCDLTHSHAKDSKNDDENSETESDVSLPIHLRLMFMHSNLKTEFLYTQHRVFMAEFPIDERQKHGGKQIRYMAPSRDGGVYVVVPNHSFLLKYSKDGKIVCRIPLMHHTSAILETVKGYLLIAYFYIKSVFICVPTMCTTELGNRIFLQMIKMIPLAMAQLKNGNIIIGGPEHMCSVRCKDNECAMEKNSPGIVQIFTDNGKLIQEIILDDRGGSIFTRPIDIACSKKAETIAVCDPEKKRVTILNYDGKVRDIFYGFNPMLPFTLFSEQEAILPLTICSTTDGNYVVSDPRFDFLQVLNPFGKFLGVLRCEDGELLFETDSLCVDTEDNIWIGHHSQGTVSVLKPTRFKNNFDPIHHPLMPRFGRPDSELPVNDFVPGFLSTD